MCTAYKCPSRQLPTLPRCRYKFMKHLLSLKIFYFSSSHGQEVQFFLRLSTIHRLSDNYCLATLYPHSHLTSYFVVYWVVKIEYFEYSKDPFTFKILIV